MNDKDIQDVVMKAVLKEEKERLEAMASLFRTVVEIRLELMRQRRWIEERGMELELAAEEMDDALHSLYKVEDCISMAQRYLLTANIIHQAGEQD